MPDYGKNEAEVRCGFYRGEARQTMRCEGFVDGTELMQTFVSEVQKEYFQEKNCCKIESDCPIRAALLKKYGE